MESTLRRDRGSWGEGGSYMRVKLPNSAHYCR
jgi:hypothetical protein